MMGLPGRSCLYEIYKIVDMSDFYEELIFGIKTKGLSFLIEKLSIDDDQSGYDYICNVASKDNRNGNGSFLISILNEDLIKGMSIGKWTLVEGIITYNWGDSYADFILKDKDGNKTKWICSANGSGSVKGFNKEALTRSIFAKAREIVSEFPNANIYNAYSEFMNNEKNPTKDSLLKFENNEDDPIRFVESFRSDTIQPLSDYIDRFENIKSILQNDDDIRSKELLNEVVDSCRATIKYLLNR